MILRYSLKEIVREWKLTLFFVLNLSVGLGCYLAVNAFNTALENEVKSNIQSILGADLVVSARRLITENEHKIIHEVIKKYKKETLVYDFFSMIQFQDKSKLVMVKAIEYNYPLYGKLELAKNNTTLSIMKDNEMLIYPELKDQIGVDLNSEVTLGKLKFKITNLVLKDQTQTFRAASIAPRVFIQNSQLKKTGLIQFGSTFSMSYLYQLDKTQNPEDFKKEIYKKITDPQITIETTETSADNASRQLAYLSDYLGLVALVAIILASLGSFYIFKLILFKRKKEFAILKSLGLDRIKILKLYFYHIFLLGLLAAPLSLFFAQMILPLIFNLISELTSLQLKTIISPHVIFVGLGVCLFISLLITLPALFDILKIRAMSLLNESEEQNNLEKKSLVQIILYFPAVIFLFGLSLLTAKSIKIGVLFSASIVGAVFVLFLVYSAIQFILRRISKTKMNWQIRFLLNSITRKSAASFSIFIVIALGTLLINLLPQIKSGLESEFNYDKKSQVPDLFLFDIQDEEVTALKENIKNNGYELFSLSPVIRARILKVNGNNFERQANDGGYKTREEEAEARFRNRGVNLSYRNKSSETEEIVSGKTMGGDWNAKSGLLPQLSIEKNYADRMGFKIGDNISFDIQGLPIDAQIVNFRKVKWTSFQPNFFILFQKGVIDEAPKTYVAGILNVPNSKRANLQSQLVQKFPNISIIDVSRVVTMILEISNKMGKSLKFMAYLCLLAGFFVIFTIIRTQVREKYIDLTILKILGANKLDLQSTLIFEFAFITFIASLLGILLSFLVGQIFSYYIFSNLYSFDFMTPALTVIIVTLISMIISSFASLQLFSIKPKTVLLEGAQ